VYIELNDKLRSKNVQDKVTKSILAHPSFKNDDSSVSFVESIAQHDTHNHCGITTCHTDKVNVTVRLQGDNPIMTASAMYASSRAAARLLKKRKYGCFTPAEIAPLDFVKGDSITERLAKIKY
jgi:hypothetical protein